MRLPVSGTVPRKKYTGADSLKKAFLAQELLAKTVPNDSLSYSAALLKNPLSLHQKTSKQESYSMSVFANTAMVKEEKEMA